MKYHYLIFLFSLIFSCQKADQTSCDLPDLERIGIQCDTFREKGKNAKAAHLYFKAGQQNQSSELFVYAAWQFGEANLADSALLAVKESIKYGLSSPYILEKLGLEKLTRDHNMREELDSLLYQIELQQNNVSNFEIVTAPVDRFWKYFDQALTDTLNGRIYLSNYICEGSFALKDYYHIRYENADKMYKVMIEKNPNYYLYLRKHISQEKLHNVAQEATQMMQKFAVLYPKAVFPKTYIVPDLINGSGTLTESSLYIGVDMFAKSDSMPKENLNDWQISTITEFENMKFDLVHELMHFQQSYADFEGKENLYGKLIEEGSCDFLVSLLTEDGEVSPGVQRNLDYLSVPKNYDFVMSELKRDIYSKDLSKWMHNGGAIKDRPSNLGYTMGFLICKSYYENANDKREAVKKILTTDDFKEIILGSDYKGILGNG
ncbi:hypothetical protein [Flammeovirga aprica]|uniref:DUF2268 domain-containing protein n=1 Tax=Flammeovirga aprica JL-4 TaxID=694437 RepID=A0A7X9S1B7_9BACT|nr:hypothetical protein [Flammeovirga aprica]NME72545.1 hypothetical protein [Flammeovirga aprica JL-4]